MKARTMVYLDPRQLKALKAKASLEGISLAALIRRLAARLLEGEQTAPSVPPSAYAKLVDLGSSGRLDVADRHDEYLAHALTREHAG